ncbi:MAG: hypothetical protein IT169_15215 [Bryobacterales bacterium]|nr:hypothetical protein [Bryobacterales bacterium]
MAIPSPQDVPQPRAVAPDDDPPPGVFGSWRNVYLCVVAYLALLIVLMYAFRVAFER